MSASALESMNLSATEMDRFTSALRDPGFRTLFADYANELANPANAAEYEAMLHQMEEQAGVTSNKRLLVPTPQFVIKLPTTPKIFINIRTSPHIPPIEPIAPTITSARVEDGLRYRIPNALTSARTFRDVHNKESRAFDVTVNESTFAERRQTTSFTAAIISVAVDAVAKETGIDTRNVQPILLRNVKFKGGQPPTRTITVDNKTTQTKPPKPQPQTQSITHFEEKTHVRSAAPSKPHKSVIITDSSACAPHSVSAPKYSIVHSGVFDMSVFDEQSSSALRSYFSARPQRIIVQIALPLVDSAAAIQTDLTESTIALTVPSIYQTTIALPFAVDTDNGSAKFSIKTHTLVLTLSVKPPSNEEIAAARSKLDQVAPKAAIQVVAVEETPIGLPSESSPPPAAGALEMTAASTDSKEESVCDVASAHSLRRSSIMRKSETPIDDGTTKKLPRSVHFEENEEPVAEKKERPAARAVSQQWTGIGVNHTGAGKNDGGLKWAPYTYSQTDSTIVLVFRVKSIRRDSVLTAIDNENVEISFSSMDSKQSFRVALQLADAVDSPSAIEVNTSNLIVTLNKRCGGLWTALLKSKSPSLSPTPSPRMSPRPLSPDVAVEVSVKEQDEERVLQEEDRSSSVTAQTSARDDVLMTSNAVAVYFDELD